MTTFNTKNQAKRKYYYMACILVILLIVVSLAFNSFRKSDNCDPNISEVHKKPISEANSDANKQRVREYVTIDTDSGQVTGQKQKFNNITVHTFLGIPYAQPPVGALRFERTAPVGKWQGVREALQQPASCLQSDSPLVLSAFRFLNSTSSEDCLYLNVWAPLQEESFLPVIVYIHGGAFAYGGVATEELDGLALAAQQDVVVVTIQYRLGIFGFMGFESKEPKGNMGLYDQREALKWIHTNINKFGGDQDLITVVGHGAGAVSAGLHMMTSDSKFFFQRTILQGFGLLFNKELYSQTTKYSQKFAEEIGCGDAPKIKECMKSINTDRLLEVQQEILEDNSVAFGPRIPGDFVDKYPSEAREAFDFQIDFMFGVNSEDDSLFLTTFKNSESEKSESESSEESGDSETNGGDSEDKEEVESREDNEDTTPVERPTMRPLLTAITSAATTTTTPEPKTMTTTSSETTMASKSTTTTTTTTTTTAAPTTTTTTTPTTTPKSTTTSTTEASDSSEKEEETDETEKEEKEEDPEAETEAEGGDDEANDDAEEKRRRRKKRETDEYTERLVCPLLKFANTMVESNRSVYIYELMEFSSHHDEIVFAMGYPLKHKNLYDNDELKFSRRVMKNWAQFATNGDISESDEQWKAYTKENPMFLKMSISAVSLEKFNLDNCFPTVNPM